MGYTNSPTYSFISRSNALMPFVMLNIILILILSSGFLVHSAKAADFAITFKDSLYLEDTWFYAGSGLANNGRAISASADRVVLYVGDNYGNAYSTLIRALAVYDSLAAYSSPVVDSARIVFKILANSMGGGEYMDVGATGIDTNRNWVEGDRNGTAAQDCEVCWDSAQTIGAGTCATAQAWQTSGAKGTTDTLGRWADKPQDSLRIDNSYVSGDSIIIYVDTQVVNLWKDYSYANEGVLVSWLVENIGNDQLSLYGSETRLTGRADSIPYFQIFGHEGGASPPSTARRRLILDK